MARLEQAIVVVVTPSLCGVSQDLKLRTWIDTYQLMSDVRFSEQ